MTISVFDRRLLYPGNDTATVFPGPKVFEANTLFAYLVDQVSFDVETLSQPSDYVVTGLGLPQSTVTLGTAPPTGKTLLLLRTVPYTQLTRFKNQGAFFPEMHEDRFDRTEMQIQQLVDLLERVIHLSDTDIDSGNLELPPFIRDYFLHVNAITRRLEWFPVSYSALRRYRSVPVVDNVLTLDCSLGDRLLVSSGGNPYLSEDIDDVVLTNLPPDGSVVEFTLEFHIDPDTGGWAITWPGFVKSAGGLPSLPTAAAAILHVGCVVYSDGQMFLYPTPVFST
jgi:hypothetical protein